MSTESEVADMDESALSGKKKTGRPARVKTPPPTPLIIDDAAARQMRLIERRLQNPTVSDDRSIALKDKSLIVRIFNGEKAGRLYHAVHRLGWRPLKITELVDREQIGDIQTSKEGYVTRGEKGREMFMVMPRDAYNQIQLKKVRERETRQNLHNKGSRAQRDEIAEATAAKFGDQAGEGVRKFVGTNPDHSAVMELDS